VLILHWTVSTKFQQFYFVFVFFLFTDEISLVALGPLTNLALAMRLDDQFASNLKELYIMGGNVEGKVVRRCVPELQE
jgi:hypothetical protein